MLIRVIDFDSTGFPPECAIVEIGWCDVTFVDRNDITIGAPQSRLCNPGQPIPPEARAIHHISDCDIKDAVSPDMALRDLNTAQVEAWCAHNAASESQWRSPGFRVGAGDRARSSTSYNVLLF
jgi:exodeoxyribonuclease X